MKAAQAVASQAHAAIATDRQLDRLANLDDIGEPDAYEQMQDLAEMEELRAKTSPRRFRPYY